MTTMRRWAMTIAICGWTAAFPQTRRLTFEVVSVKPAVAPEGVSVVGGSMTVPRGTSRDDLQRLRNTGGPGSTDPGRIHYPLVSLSGLLKQAFETYVEVKAPDWADTDVVSVDATMPAEATKEQFREMLRSLLEDRFQLKYHVAAKEIGGYALVVAKSGTKLKEAAEAPSEPAEADAPRAPRPRQIGPDGWPIPPSRPGSGFLFQSMPGERARAIGQWVTMTELARTLEGLLNSRITDETGLTAKYDIVLTFAGHLGVGGVQAATQPAAASADASAPEPLPDIFSALQSQLGLKLEQKKVTVETVVVDHMEKAPSGN